MMDGYEALALALDLIDKGMSTLDASDEALETMEAVNSGNASLIVDLAA